MNSVIYTLTKSGNYEPYDIVYVKKYIEDEMRRLLLGRGQRTFGYQSPIDLIVQTMERPKFSAYDSIGDTPLTHQVKTTQVRAKLMGVIGMIGRDDISFVVSGEALKSRLEKCGQGGKTQLVERIRDIIANDLKYI